MRTFPRGLDVEVFSRNLLEKVSKLAHEKYQREHVTPYFYENPSKFKLINLNAEGKLKRPEFRLCVDTKEDLELVREIYKRLYEPPDIVDNEKVIDLLKNEPKLTLINKEVKQKRLKD